jgi:ribonuclease P protein component
MDFSYPRHEKLKSRKTIERMFAEGKSVAKFPLRLAYIENSESVQPIEIGVSVSKKYFKKAVDRNYFKRLLREAYRHNKHLIANLDKRYALMLLYQTKDRLAYQEISVKVVALFEKFRAETASAPPK